MTGASPALLADLAAAVGDEALILDPAERHGYEVPARYEAGQAAVVVRPRSTEDVSAVVRICRRHGARLVPQGANTGLVGGSTPDRGGDQVLLSLERLRAPLQIDVANRSILAGAGVRLSALNAALDPHSLFLPIDLGADPTLGGMVSTNTGGARFIRYGDMRRQVLGLRVVLGDEAGTVIKLGRGLRKDNTGLDLRDLFVGAGGALGVVTEVELEVQRQPRQAAAALISLDDPAAALPLLEHFERQAGELLAAFEGMSRAALERALAHAPALRAPFRGEPPPYAVLVELSCVRPPRLGETSVESVLEGCLAEWWDRDDPATLDALTGRPEDLWAVRHAISEGLRAAGAVVGFDLAFRRGDLAPFRARILPVLAARFPEFTVCDFGHIGDGGVHFNLVCEGAAALNPARVAALRACVHDVAVGTFGASFSGEHGLGRANLEPYRTYTDPAIRRLAGAVHSAIADAPLGVIDFTALAG